jgi:hypothetical protein
VAQRGDMGLLQKAQYFLDRENARGKQDAEYSYYYRKLKAECGSNLKLFNIKMRELRTKFLNREL